MNSLPISLLLILIILHYIGDFVLQSGEMAIGKSTDNGWLSYHVAVYTLTLFAGVAAWGVLSSVDSPLSHALSFAALNGAIHWGIDWVTSRINAKLWKDKRVHGFFVGVGTDQLTHYATLVLTASWLPT